MASDLRFAFRGLKKSPGFAVTAVATLALGIGATTAIFSLVNQLLLNPPGVTDPEGVVAVRVRYGKLNMTSIGMSAPNFANVRDSRELFEYTAIAGDGQYNYTGGTVPEQLKGVPVSVEWFDVFGAKPRLGRVFQPEEDQPNANHVVVLAYAAWQRLFGGDPAMVGKTLELNQIPYKIIGVMGPEFRRPQQEDLWTPLGLESKNYTEDYRFNERFFAVARLKQGVTIERADAFIDVLADHVRQNGTGGGQYAQDSQWGMFAVPITEFIARETKTPLLVLSGAVGLVLLIACSNIAGLMLARASGRSREIAVRIAMGARGWQLLRQTLSESVLLAFGGAVAGLALAYGGIRLLLQLAPESAAAGLEPRIDLYVLLFTAAAAILSGLLFGIAPAWQVGRLNPYEILKSGGRSATTGRGRQRLRAALVVGEAALALVLLVGAGLFLRSFSRLQEVNPGFQPHGLMTATLSLPPVQYDQPEKRIAFYRALLERLQVLPGVTSVGLGIPLPFSGNSSSASFSVEGREQAPGDPGPHGNVRWVTPGYFESMSIPLKSGRYFSDSDRQGTEPVVVIDENLARQYWPGQDVVGKHMRNGGDNTPWSTVVGVVGHIKHSDLATDEEKGTYYYSMFQVAPPYAGIVARTRQEPTSLASAIRQGVLAVDPKQPVDQLRTMERMIGDSLAAQRLATRLLGFFATAALFLAALGLYGVISYSVVQRTQEIGVRMALGAQPGEVLALVVGQGLRLAASGVGLGLVLAVICSRAVESQLFGVTALDPLTFVSMAAVLFASALLASYLPARRATKVDPLHALRYE
jgi:putative ABC transport system permease protein